MEHRQGLSLITVKRNNYLTLNYSELLNACEIFFESLSVSLEQAKKVELKTREQSGSKVWFQQRAGIITASRLKSSVCTDILSLLSH